MEGRLSRNDSLLVRVLPQYPQHVRCLKEEGFAETVVEGQTRLVGGDNSGVPSGDKADIDDARTLQVSFFPTRPDGCERCWRDKARWGMRLLEVEELDMSSCVSRCNESMIVGECEGGHRANRLFCGPR
jgi:hypothetical protein